MSMTKENDKMLVSQCREVRVFPVSVINTTEAVEMTTSLVIEEIKYDTPAKIHTVQTKNQKPTVPQSKSGNYCVPSI